MILLNLFKGTLYFCGFPVSGQTYYVSIKMICDLTVKFPDQNFIFSS